MHLPSFITTYLPVGTMDEWLETLSNRIKFREIPKGTTKWISVTT